MAEGKGWPTFENIPLLDEVDEQSESMQWEETVRAELAEWDARQRYVICLIIVYDITNSLMFVFTLTCSHVHLSWPKPANGAFLLHCDLLMHYCSVCVIDSLSYEDKIKIWHHTCSIAVADKALQTSKGNAKHVGIHIIFS